MKESATTPALPDSSAFLATPTLPKPGSALLAGPRALVLFLAAIARRPLLVVICAVLLGLFAFGTWLGGRQVWAWYHYRAAREAVEHYHSNDAIRHLSACLWVWPNDPDVLVLAARTARRRDALDEAERFLQRAQGMKRDYDPVLERLLLRAARGEIDEVEKVCQMRVEQNDAEASLILEALVAGCLRALRLRLADSCLHRWIEREPNNPQAMYYRGLIFEQMSLREEALSSFRRALEIDPELDPARLHLAVQFLDRLRGAEAIPHLEYLRSRDSSDLRIPVFLAQCKVQTGQQPEAEAILDEVMAQNPNFPPALAERGKLAMSDGDIELAEKLLSRAAALEPADHSVHYQLSLCLSKLGRTEEAAAIQKRLKQIEDDLTSLRDIVNVQMAKSPRDVALHYQAGMIAMRAGAHKDALRWFDSALQIEPEHAPTHRALAEFYQKIGQLGESQKHWEIAKKVDPEGTTSRRPAAPAPKK